MAYTGYSSKETNLSRYNPNVYEQQILAKGRDLPAAKIARHAEVYQRQVPAAFADRYATWDEYAEALADFLNGN